MHVPTQGPHGAAPELGHRKERTMSTKKTTTNTTATSTDTANPIAGDASIPGGIEVPPSLADAVAAYRVAQVVPAHAIPAVPPGVPNLDPSVKPNLYRFADTQAAEVREALTECAANQDALQRDLGKF